MFADITNALRDGPLTLDALAQALGSSDGSAIRPHLDAAIDEGLVTARHLQTLPPRTLYGLTKETS